MESYEPIYRERERGRERKRGERARHCCFMGHELRKLMFETLFRKEWKACFNQI